jgi:hypothetical protein
MKDYNPKQTVKPLRTRNQSNGFATQAKAMLLGDGGGTELRAKSVTSFSLGGQSTKLLFPQWRTPQRLELPLVRATN